MRRGYTLCTLGLVLALTACAGDPATDSIRPTRAATEHESPDAPPGALKAEAVVRVADASARRGDWPLAASLYRRARMLDAANYDASAGLATALARAGAHRDALEAWQHALTLKPEDTSALRGIANTLIRIGQPEKALPYLEQALVKSNDPKLYSSMGAACDLIGEHGTAQTFYRTALESEPKNLGLRNNLALSLLMGGEADEAVKELRRVVAEPAATRRHRGNLSLALVFAGDPQTALAIARMDYPPDIARDRVGYFETLAAIDDPMAAREALRNHLRGGE